MKNLLIVLMMFLSVSVFGQKPKKEVPIEENKINGQISELRIFDLSELSPILQKADEFASKFELTSKTDVEKFLDVIDTDVTTYIFNYVFSNMRKYSYIRVTNTKNDRVILVFRYNDTFCDCVLTSKR